MNQTHLSPDDPRLTAYALGELESAERAQVAAAIAGDPVAQAAVDEIRALAGRLEEALENEPIIAAPSQVSPDEELAVPARAPEAKVIRFPFYWASGLAAACLIVALVTRFETQTSPVVSTPDFAAKSSKIDPAASATRLEPVLEHPPLPVVESRKNFRTRDPSDVNPAPLREDGLSRARSVAEMETGDTASRNDPMAAPSIENRSESTNASEVASTDSRSQELLDLRVRYELFDANRKVEVPSIDTAAGNVFKFDASSLAMGKTLKVPGHKGTPSQEEMLKLYQANHDGKEDAAGRPDDFIDPAKKPTRATVE